MKSRDTGPYEELIERLYLEAFPAAAAFIAKMGGSFDQTKDVFQDALVIYYESVVVTGKSINSTERSYLIGITRHLWYNEYKKGQYLQPLEEVELEGLDDFVEPMTSKTSLMNFLESTGKKCMDMLKAFYYDRLSLANISEQFGYAGTRSATVQKYKCLEKVREEVRERKLTYADFTD